MSVVDFLRRHEQGPKWPLRRAIDAREFVFSALTTAPRPLLPFEIVVQLLDLFVKLNGGASIKHELLPVRRTVEANIIAADDL